MTRNNFDSPVKSTLQWAAAGLGVFLVARSIAKEVTKFHLAGKVVLITGGSRGFGLVLARHLANRGAKLAITARSADDLELARQELDSMGAEVIPMTADMTNNEEVQAVVRDVIYQYGHLDVLINNAGILQVGPQALVGREEYQVAMQTNFWPQLFAMHAVIPHFLDRGRGRIVNITSIGGKIALPHLLPHAAQGVATAGLSEGMHAELKKYNIHVTTVVPNLMRTGGPLHSGVEPRYPADRPRTRRTGVSALSGENPDEAAEKILNAIEYGDREVAFSMGGKVATFVKGFAPAWVNLMMRLTDTLLPDTPEGVRSKA